MSHHMEMRNPAHTPVSLAQPLLPGYEAATTIGTSPTAASGGRPSPNGLPPATAAVDSLHTSSSDLVELKPVMAGNIASAFSAAAAVAAASAPTSSMYELLPPCSAAPDYYSAVAEHNGYLPTAAAVAAVAFHQQQQQQPPQQQQQQQISVAYSNNRLDAHEVWSVGANYHHAMTSNPPVLEVEGK